jgi:Fur family ferric uptake transcriptional regulator
MEDQHRPLEAGGLTNAVIEDLRRRGLRLTPQRLMILELLEQSKDEHIAPEDIYQRVLQRYPMINRSTVYRTLDVLEEVGMVRHGHVEDGAARYHLARDCRHLHLICHKCGCSIDVTDLSIADSLIRALSERFSFQADLTHFPISGLCAGCAAKRNS